MRRLAIFLVRRRLKLKLYEYFRFDNQKEDAIYYFTTDALMKIWNGKTQLANTSMNWLLDSGCGIERLFLPKDARGA